MSPSLHGNPEKINRLVAEGKYYRRHNGHVSMGPGDDGSWYLHPNCHACGWRSTNEYPHDEVGAAKAQAEADEHNRVENPKVPPGGFVPRLAVKKRK